MYFFIYGSFSNVSALQIFITKEFCRIYNMNGSLTCQSLCRPAAILACTDHINL